jgi:hypothetical protein
MGKIDDPILNSHAVAEVVARGRAFVPWTVTSVSERGRPAA